MTTALPKRPHNNQTHQKLTYIHSFQAPLSRSSRFHCKLLLTFTEKPNARHHHIRMTVYLASAYEKPFHYPSKSCTGEIPEMHLRFFRIPPLLNNHRIYLRIQFSFQFFILILFIPKAWPQCPDMYIENKKIERHRNAVLAKTMNSFYFVLHIISNSGSFVNTFFTL